MNIDLVKAIFLALFAVLSLAARWGGDETAFFWLLMGLLMDRIWKYSEPGP